MARETATEQVGGAVNREPRAGDWYSDAGREFEVVANHGEIVDIRYADEDELTPMDIALFRDGSVTPA